MSIYVVVDMNCISDTPEKSPLATANYVKKNKKTIDIAGIIWKEAYNIRLIADAIYKCTMNQYVTEWWRRFINR
jgi:hypothetical protein